MRRSTISELSRWAAQWRAVEPSTSTAFTSTCCAINERKVFTSIFLTASINRRSPEAAPNEFVAAVKSHAIANHLPRFFMYFLRGKILTRGVRDGGFSHL